MIVVYDEVLNMADKGAAILVIVVYDEVLNMADHRAAILVVVEYGENIPHHSLLLNETTGYPTLTAQRDDWLPHPYCSARRLVTPFLWALF